MHCLANKQDPTGETTQLLIEAYPRLCASKGNAADCHYTAVSLKPLQLSELCSKRSQRQHNSQMMMEIAHYTLIVVRISRIPLARPLSC